MNAPVTLQTEKGLDVESTEHQTKVTLFHEAVDLSDVIRQRRPRPFICHEARGLPHSLLHSQSHSPTSAKWPHDVEPQCHETPTRPLPLAATPSLEAVAVGASTRAQNSKVWQRISRITHWEQKWSSVKPTNQEPCRTERLHDDPSKLSSALTIELPWL